MARKDPKIVQTKMVAIVGWILGLWMATLTLNSVCS